MPEDITNTPENVTTESPNHAAPLDPRRLMRSVLIVIIGFAITKAITLIQVFVITDEFGLESDYDSFTIADSAQTQIVKFLAVGVVAVAFIPVFNGLLNRNENTAAWRLASQVFNTLLLITLFLAIFIGLTANFWVENVIARGFSASEAQRTAELLRILMLSPIIFSLSSLFTGVLNGHNHFLLPALAPIFQDIGLLFGAIFFTDQWGIHGLAWGAVLGASLHFLVQVPGLFIYKAKWSFSLGWNDPKLREVLRLMFPRMLASGVFTINFLAFSNVASSMPEGTASAFGWGLRIMDIPEALIGTALGIVIFPTMAALTELKQVEERAKVFSEAIRFILIATIPASIGMILIGHSAISILPLDADEVNLVYASMQVFAFAMILQAVHEIVARGFYAEKDTVTPLIASAAGMVGNLIILFLLFTTYKETDLLPFDSPVGVGIPAIGYLTAFVIELGILIVILKNRWGNLGQARIMRVVYRTIGATALMAIGIIIIDFIFTDPVFGGGGRISTLLHAGINGIVGVVIFAVSAWVLDIKEVKQFPALIRQHLRKQPDPELL